MKTTKSDILLPPDYVDAICIPTNQILKTNGEGTWGKGLTVSAKKKWPDLPRLQGKFMQMGKMGTTLLKVTIDNKNSHALHIYSFPTKNHWSKPSSIDLIETSARELVQLADYNRHEEVWLPAVGCGLGGLKWSTQVGPLLNKILDERFTIVFKP